MVRKLVLLFALLNAGLTHAQNNADIISTGTYDGGQLQLAFNPQTNIITGFYQNYTGWDEETQASKFSCVFYMEGKLIGNAAAVATYYPLEGENDLIKGTLKILDNNSVSISLPEEHGGCWNVQHFIDEPVRFIVDTPRNWIEIRHVTAVKTFFHTTMNEASKRKSYMVRGDIFYIDKIENGWLHGQYRGKSITEGWIKSVEMNPLKP